MLGAATISAFLVAQGAAAATAAPAGQLLVSPLQNIEKTTYVGTHGAYWVDTLVDPTDVSYPEPGTTGILSIGGTCVPFNAQPGVHSMQTIPVGDGASCLTFLAELTTEGLFTFRVDSPGAPADGRYLGDGSRGGILDLISTSPDVLFKAPERPNAVSTLSGQLEQNNPSSPVQAGDHVVWETRIENRGNVSFTIGSIRMSSGIPLQCTPLNVAIGTSASCVARSAPLTQAQIDSGSISDGFSGTATTPSGTLVDLGTPTSTVPLPAQVSAAIAITEVSVGPLYVGDTARIGLTVLNKGNVTLTAVAVTNEGWDISCPTDQLAPGEAQQCFAGLLLTKENAGGAILPFTFAGEGITPNGSTYAIPPASGELAISRPVLPQETEPPAPSEPQIIPAEEVSPPGKLASTGVAPEIAALGIATLLTAGILLLGVAAHRASTSRKRQ